MNKWGAIIFLIVIGIVMAKPYYPYFDYMINKDYISEYLCIDKDKQINECQGKCHLKSQIKKQSSDNNQDYPNSNQKKIKTSLYFQVFEDDILIIEVNNLKHQTFISNFLSSHKVEIPTPPPQFLFS